MEKQNLTFEEASLTFRKGSHKKVLFTCPICRVIRLRPYRECFKIKRCADCYHSKTTLTYEDAIGVLTPKSIRKVIFTCRNCKLQSERAFKSCETAKYCKHCYSHECGTKNKLTTEVLTLEKALESGKMRSKVLVLLTCKNCNKERIQKLANVRGSCLADFKEISCSECAPIKLSKTKLTKTARKLGFNDNLEFAQAVIKYLEETGFGPGSIETQTYFKTTRMVLSDLLEKHGRKDLVMDKGTSSTERLLIDFIKSFYPGTLIENDRKVLAPKELDIYLPDLNMAIEYNGLWWHTEDKKGRDFHVEKYKNCLRKGIKLYTIWEHQYIKNPNAIKSFIKNLILNKTRVFARKCTITNNIEKIKEFIKNNHIQGLAVSHTYLGLEFEGKIVMAISVGNPHRNNIECQVLNRVCFGDFNVIGGLQKLLKLVPKPLITWSDNCYSPIGTMYSNNGFKLVKESRPDYFYCDRNGYYLSKHSQSKKSSKCPEGLTEYQWSKARNLYRIWNCGKKTWILE